MTLSIAELRDRAKALVRDALSAHPPIPDGYREQLVLGMGLEGDERIFELYVPADRPEDGLLLAIAKLNVHSGEGLVQVFPERWTE
ncbi:MAG: hypothetical protein AAGE52_37540 [Myxococcota bacterium]